MRDFAAVFTTHGLADADMGDLATRRFLRTGPQRLCGCPHRRVASLRQHPARQRRRQPLSARPDDRAMVVVFGSINLDLVTRVERFPSSGETVAGRSFASYPGGKGANQALACRARRCDRSAASARSDATPSRPNRSRCCARRRRPRRRRARRRANRLRHDSGIRRRRKLHRGRRRRQRAGRSAASCPTRCSTRQPSSCCKTRSHRRRQRGARRPRAHGGTRA